MATKKDMRREDLIVPYMPPEDAKDSQDFTSTMTSTLPMAAMFTRNKMFGWTAVLFAVQQWLSESSAQKAVASSPAYLSVGMAILSLGVGYMPLFLPPAPGRGAGPATGTGAPAAAGS